VQQQQQSSSGSLYCGDFSVKPTKEHDYASQDAYLRSLQRTGQSPQKPVTRNFGSAPDHDNFAMIFET